MAEKLISIFGLIFVTSFVAKYVGPSIFGQIALATSFFQIVQVIAQLGSDIIIFKRISKNNASGIKLIKSTASIRLIIYLIASIPVILYSIKDWDLHGVIFVFSCFLACLFSSMDVFSIYYDARLESRKNTIVNFMGLLISLFLRWIIAFKQLDPLLLSIPIIMTGFIPYFIRRLWFQSVYNSIRIDKKYNWKYKRYLLRAGATFVISSLSVAIYTRISMLMLGFFDGDSAVGIFSVAVSLAASWSFICNAFIISTLPSIFSEKDDDKAEYKTASLNLLVILIGIPIIIGISSFGYYVILHLYGEGFIGAYIPLIIVSVSTLMSLLGTISARYIARYSGYSFLSKKMLTVSFFSFFISIPLVYWYGIIGAALCSLLTEFFSMTFFNYFFKKGVVFRLHMLTLSPKMSSCFFKRLFKSRS